MKSKNDDLSGKSQFARNVIVSWVTQIFIVVVGFVVPRQISDQLGMEALGIWDLGWATVRYLTLTQLGVAAALNRYVALYRAKNEALALNQATTSVLVWQSIVALLTIAVSLLFALNINAWLEQPSAAVASESSYVIFLLGLSLAVKMLSTPAGGIITGCHRYDLQHSLNAGHDFFLGVLMISILFLGGGLKELAIAAFVMSILDCLLRIRVAYNLYPDAKVGFKYWDATVAIEMLRFGVKSILTTAPQIIVFQTVVLFLAGSAGAASVAVFNRAVALIRILEQFIRKTAMMLTPMTSGLVGLSKKGEALELLQNVGRLGMAVSLPLMLGLVFFGDLVIEVWMGKEYGNWPLMIVLGLGSVIPLAQTGTFSVLTGLNNHGVVSVKVLIITIIVLALSLVYVDSNNIWSDVNAGIVVGLSWSTGIAIAIPLFLKKQYGMGVFNYVLTSLLQPCALCIPLAVGWYFSRIIFLENRLLISISIFMASVGFTAVLYWFYVIPKSIQEKILTKIQNK